MPVVGGLLGLDDLVGGSGVDVTPVEAGLLVAASSIVRRVDIDVVPSEGGGGFCWSGRRAAARVVRGIRGCVHGHQHVTPRPPAGRAKTRRSRSPPISLA